MSNGTTGDGRRSRNETREAARQKAQILRDQHKKKDRRTRFVVQGSIILGALVIVTIVALVLTNSVKSPGAGPLNMASDGIQLTKGAVATKTPALKPNQQPTANKRDESVSTLDIQIYVDYLCALCGEFESTNGKYITSLLDNGKTTLEIHPIAILDRLAQGTRYSTRAANAAACVANYSPREYYAFHNELFAEQPKENTPGLSDEQLVKLTAKAKVSSAGRIDRCITDQQFKAWVTASTSRALTGPIPNSNVDKVTDTATVIVNGLKYTGAMDNLKDFQSFVIQAAGNDFTENPTATPTPAPVGN